MEPAGSLSCSQQLATWFGPILSIGESIQYFSRKSYGKDNFADLDIDGIYV